MNEIQELYQQLIIDHGCNPRNFGCLEPADCIEEGYNPLCGDRIKLYLQWSAAADSASVISAARFEGCGCAISMASASLMTEAIMNLNKLQAEALFHQFHDLLIGKQEEHQDGHLDMQLGKLMALSGVKAFPMRIKCATLAWHTLISAISPRRN